MDYRAIDFLKNFEYEDRSRIIEFGKRISSSDLKADVYIVMARKAICFIDALTEFNLCAMNGIVISDRALDMDLSWLKNNHIVIIDDALVSGTTIRKAINKLNSVGVKSIRVCVLSINDKWYNKEILVDDNDYLVKPINRLNDYKCMHMCYTIVKALSTIPKPYDIDFPLFEEIFITNDELNRILNNSWITYNVTSDSFISNISDRRREGKKFVKNDFESLTLMPTKVMIDEFCDYYGLMLGENCILKMRVYLRKSKKDKTRKFASFLPFVIFNDIELSIVDKMCSKFIDHTEYIDIFSSNFTTSFSKLRFLQYVLSYHLAFFFFKRIFIDVENKYVLHSKLFSSLSIRRIKYIFPCETANLVLSVLMESYSREIIYIDDRTTVNSTIKSFSCSINTNNVIGIYEKLSEVFLHLYRSKEIKARKLAKLKGKSVLEDKDYRSIVNRLEMGYTFNDLKSLISHLSHSAQFVSLFLDYAIDTGIAVPIICIRDGKICRAYRHGEDVIFAEKEAEQITYMLYVFQSYAECNVLSNIILDNLLTAFIRIGITENIFERYDYKNISSDIHDYLKIIYLNGPTVRLIENNVIPSPFTLENEVSTCLIDVLLSKKMLIQVNDNYCVNYNIINNLQKKHELIVSGINAKNIAKTIAYFYRKQYLTEDDFIKLNSTYGEEQIIPSLAAYIDAIRRKFQKYEQDIRIILKKINSNDVRLNSLSIRSNDIFIVLNNAMMQMESYINGKPESIVNGILKRRNKDIENEHFYDFLVKYWNAQISSVSKEPLEEVSCIIRAFFAYLYQYNLITRKIEIMLFKMITGKIKNSPTRAYNKLKNFTCCENILKSRWLLQAINNRCVTIEDFLEHLRWLNVRIGESILSANHFINNRGEIEKPIYYNNIICIKFVNRLKAGIIIDEIYKKIKKKQLSILKRGNKETDLEIQVYNDDSVTIFCRGEENETEFFRLAMEINRELNIENNMQIDVFLKLRKVIAPFRFVESVESINIINFQELCFNLREVYEKIDYTVCVINDCMNPINKFIEAELRKKGFKQKEITSLSHEYISERRFNVNYISNDIMKQGVKIKKGKVFGVITAKDVETKAVIDILSKEFNSPAIDFFEKRENDRLITKIQIIQNNKTHEIYIIKQIRQGNVSSAIAYNILQLYKPDIIIFVGIAGSLNKEIKIGDVIIPHSIFDTTLKKEKNDELQIRGTIFKIKSRTMNYIELLKRTHSPNKNFNIFCTEMISDNTVIATDDSELLKKVFEFNDKVAGVEMESAGIYDSDYQQQKQSFGVISIRGISDNANSIKNDSAHVLAATNAAITLYEFICIIITNT